MQSSRRRGQETASYLLFKVLNSSQLNLPGLVQRSLYLHVDLRLVIEHLLYAIGRYAACTSCFIAAYEWLPLIEARLLCTVKRICLLVKPESLPMEHRMDGQQAWFFRTRLAHSAASCFARTLAASSKGGCALLGRGAQGIITREQRWHERTTNTERRLVSETAQKVREHK
jgi:hypothetical protein